jgi:two-component system KDP operon response regulator KdpE
MSTLFSGTAMLHQSRIASAHEKQSEYLRVLVRSLRQKVEADPSRPTLILNEPGVSYRLVVLP